MNRWLVQSELPLLVGRTEGQVGKDSNENCRRIGQLHRSLRDVRVPYTAAFRIRACRLAFGSGHFLRNRMATATGLGRLLNCGIVTRNAAPTRRGHQDQAAEDGDDLVQQRVQCTAQVGFFIYCSLYGCSSSSQVALADYSSLSCSPPSQRSSSMVETPSGSTACSITRLGMPSRIG